VPPAACRRLIGSSFLIRQVSDLGKLLVFMSAFRFKRAPPHRTIFSP
jgi:hypothetical protein